MQAADHPEHRQAIAQRLEAWRARAEHALAERLPQSDATPTQLHRAMRYAMLGGGKRMRPLLCYAAGEALGVAPDALDDAACAVELIHGFSLVHDDLPAMDDDALRRGQPTVHKAFGVATAILTGDALQTQAFAILAHARGSTLAARVAMLQVLADASGSLGMTGGQALDLAAEGRQLGLDQLRKLHALKTGCLIRASVAMACCACLTLAAQQRDGLDRFASDIGLAFQIRDDILDIEGNTAVLGKTAGKDATEHKSTYPALLGMDGARREAETLYRRSLDALAPFGDRAAALRELAIRIVQRDR